MEIFSRCLIETNKDFSLVAKKVGKQLYMFVCFRVYCLKLFGVTCLVRPLCTYSMDYADSKSDVLTSKL